MVREMDFVDECYADKDLSLLKKLTLVIPTYNRNFYLSRCLWYHAHFPFGQIIVADSSPEEKKVVNRETVEKVREIFGANILYLEYEPETEKYGGDIYRKWGDAVQHVETEYSQICTDKEFLVPSTVNKCILFLEENQEHSSVSGLQYFQEEKRLVPWNIISIDANSPIKRLEICDNAKYCSGFLLTIQRTKNHKQYYTLLENYNIMDLHFGECFLELQPMLFGKIAANISLAGKIRDQTNQMNSLVATNFKDSSATRYPTVKNYPHERILEYSKRYETAIASVALLLKQNTDDTKSLQSLAKSIFTWWFYPERLSKKKMPPTQTLIFQKHPYLYKLWLYIPFNIRYAIGQLIGEKTKYNIERATNELEITIVQSIITNTKDKYKDDKVCFLEKYES